MNLTFERFPFRRAFHILVHAGVVYAASNARRFRRIDNAACLNFWMPWSTPRERVHGISSWRTKTR